MKTFVAEYKRMLSIALTMAVLIGLCSCGKKESYIDPHAGEVCVSDGNGGEMWVPLYDDIPASSFTSDEFCSDGSYIDYDGTAYSALRGIDVSEHQGAIDWQAVRSDGVEFAIIRAGYRGYSEGNLYEDAYFQENMEGAEAAGIKVGVYFFSQAVNVSEAGEEAAFLLDTIKDYKIDLPVFFDWEKVSGVDETRTEAVDGTTVTDCCLAFCNAVKSAGYETGVYFYRRLGYYDYELDRLGGLVFWAGAPGSAPDFYYEHAMWQYSYTGAVSGVEGEADLDLLFEKKTDASESADPDTSDGDFVPPEVTSPSP